MLCVLILSAYITAVHIITTVSVLLQAGSQLEALSEEQPDGALLEACLHSLSLVFTSLQSKNPLRRAIARYQPHY